jgi:hypothetical protein
MARQDTPTILYVVTTSTGQYSVVNFRDNSIEYFNKTINQTYEYVLIDNTGSGAIRISFIPGLELTSPISGSKTLKAGESLYIEDSISLINIYFIESSTVEIVGISS